VGQQAVEERGQTPGNGGWAGKKGTEITTIFLFVLKDCFTMNVFK
jgi:hypothetical protein